MAFDPIAEKIYWIILDPSTNDSKIAQANFDGGSPEIVVGGLSGHPTALTFDATHGKVYWTQNSVGVDPSSRVSQIVRVDSDGSNMEVLAIFQRSATLRDIELDLIDGKMYWTSGFVPGIWRANIEVPPGELPHARTDIELVVSARRPVDLDLDLSAGKVYWTDFRDQTIRRVNLAGNSVETLQCCIEEGPNHLTLDIDNGFVYGSTPNRSHR